MANAMWHLCLATTTIQFNSVSVTVIDVTLLFANSLSTPYEVSLGRSLWGACATLGLHSPCALKHRGVHTL